MMAQYRRVKGELPKEALLLFRLGDFYEMFLDDAVLGASILGVALTKRGDAPMCGIPYHAAGGYIAKILKAGHKVAICDQVEEAKPGQLVKREVTQILSPGTHFDERMLQPERNNFLASVSPGRGGIGLAVVDLTTGDFRATVVPDTPALLGELERLKPSEIVVPSTAASLADTLRAEYRCLTPYDDWVFAPENASFTMLDHFKVGSLDGFGLRSSPSAVGAAGGVLHYLTHHLRRDIRHLTRFTFYVNSDFLVLDSVSLRNLEILDPLHPDSPRGSSLFQSMNRCVTPMGARKLREWLVQPLSSRIPIERRQDAVEAWMNQPRILEDFRLTLKEVRDLERTVNRLSMGTGNARDLVALRGALEQAPRLTALLRDLLSQPDPNRALALPLPPPQDTDAPQPLEPLLAELAGGVADLPELADALRRGLVDDPPLAVKEGGMIKDGFSSDLDELRRAGRDGKEWIARLQQEEIEKTGIPSLKIRFNSVFGYFLEVTKTHLDKVPPHYIRKQTIANGERYFTPELKEMEGKILGAQERSTKLEYELFLQLRERVLGMLSAIQGTASSLAQLDVLATFAENARLHRYCRPKVGEEGILLIAEGRHPVLEQSVVADRFVPNDTDLDPAQRQIALITGPNMAGKSTYIRQVALLAIMAHTGSFVPADSARIDLVDRIFTRIGASDDLGRGQSTFMVEMSETAQILNSASPSALVILDEIGRGTSTFDGLSLAWSIVEHVHNQVGAKCLFATHYHELTELAGKLARVRNLNVAVREWNDQIVFLRKIIEGGADKSYGIHVARLAGVPKPVIERAKEILANLEASELTPEGNVRQSAKHRAERQKLRDLSPPPQLDLFGL
ncbi:MAG: DNA mismatch repair protein MutS [Verrucomicrobia bacterium]|nr:DNA mismatch repair protein MutS [Verrucomicrobiota bacterium]